MNPESGRQPSNKLTRFICQELLYEFVTGRLDSERQAAMDSYLNECRDSQRELERLKRGLRYTQVAARLEVSRELREALEEFEPQWKKTLAAWSLWSSQRGWKALPYVFIALALALGLAVSKPWRSISRNEVTLVEQLKIEPDLESLPANVKIEPAAVVPQQSVMIASPSPQPEVPSPTVQVEESAEPKDAPAQDQRKVAPGALTRGDVEVSDFADSWPKIRDKIVALGGKVAGNVELGWLRRKDESYFHFSIPESNREELNLFLKTFGPVRFSTEPHPRVMPDGQIRIILTVKDGGTSHEGPSETP